jgi:hypothetical protein
MIMGHHPITSFEQWYVEYDPAGRNGCLEFRGIAECGNTIWNEWQVYKREMDARVHNYDVLEKLADGEVISQKPDLPNVSSGETAGLVRRMARNLVQNTPNVEVISEFDDDTVPGIFSKHILTSKVIGTDQYSNDMQQNLFASTKMALTLGFDCVVPVLLQDAAKGWYIKYDNIHYRDVFPEPGVKDVREAQIVYVRRYLTRQEVWSLIHSNAPGWDQAALKTLVQNPPPNREHQSTPHQTKKHRGQTPEGYEIITRYTSDGEPFLTFSGNDKMLLRIERNKHPLKMHPVHFLILEKDLQQPLGKSQVELLVGRQDFQDLMLNGAMKLWYRNINPSIIGYGTVNAIPNLSPGKYTQISNPNAKIEAFEVNTQTLMQYGAISEQNLGSMVNMIGSADQQMATQAGNGFSATPQGVEAQQAMVDITTNNFQKAIESFFSHYCSYALTLYFQELKAVKQVSLTADARQKLLEANLPVEELNRDGTLNIDFETLATEYFVRVVPGSLVEMEDEKQLRILNELFVPLSQAMPAIAAAQDQEMITNAVRAMQYIIGKQIELSGASSAQDIGILWKTGDVKQVAERDQKIAAVEDAIHEISVMTDAESTAQTQAITSLQEQVSLMAQNQQLLLEKLGVTNEQSAPSSPTAAPVEPQQGDEARPLP